MLDDSKLRVAARYVRWTAGRVREAVEGKNDAVWRRLKREGRVVTGPHTYGIPTVLSYIHDSTRLVAGDYCSLNGTYLLGGRHPVDRVTTYPARILWRMEGAGTDGYPSHTGDTVVGSDVWSGAGAMILSGVHLGHGAVVAGGALVTKDVPPYAIVGGNPAKVIRYRHTEEQRAALLEIAWWDWPEDEVKAAVPLLCGDDIDAFIAYARERFPRSPGSQ